MRVLPATLSIVLAVAATLGLGGPLTDLPIPAPIGIAETTIRRGDTWESALGRLGAPRPVVGAILGRLGRQVDPRLLRPTERLLLARGYDGRLLGVTYQRSPLERLEIRPDGEGWTVRRILTPVVTRVAAVSGRVDSSLFVTMDRLGERPQLTTMFVQTFESEFDFAADALPGDRFRLLVEKQYAREEFTGYGRILIAQYQSTGRRPLIAAAFPTDRGGTEYYDVEGRSLEKMFLRAPLDFTRITSGYSHARRHPILGGVRPHLAVDYAAPAGTPVRAVADGIVTHAGWDGGNGITVTLLHARGYQTMYNHLSRLRVRPYERVRQRQVIGLVGSTGISTGPHLDYRIAKHHSFVNPLVEKFIPGQELPASVRPVFVQRLRALLERLEREAPFPS